MDSKERQGIVHRMDQGFNREIYLRECFPGGRRQIVKRMDEKRQQVEKLDIWRDY